MIYILGLNCFHADSSACLLKDGKILIALEEERINRIKHWAGFPILSIKKCLEFEGINIDNIDYIAINQNPTANILKKIKYTFLSRPNFNFYLEKLSNKIKRQNILKLIESRIGKLNKNCKLINVEHHLSHVASSYYDSHYDKSVNLSVDGFGDFVSTTWGISIKNKVTIHNKIFFPHSLGIFYEAFTQFLGFQNYGDEYKLMGLSALGKDSEISKFDKIIKLKSNGEFQLNLEYFNHHKKKISYSWDNAHPVTNYLFNNKINSIFGLPRKENEPLTDYHKNIAASVQKIYENALFNIMNVIHKKYKINSLTLSGGCAQNSLANGKILNNTKFTSLFVPANAGDGGGSAGAAYIAWERISRLKPIRNTTAYLGINYTNSYIKNVIEQSKIKLNRNDFTISFVEDEDKLCFNIAKEISNQKVIGLFQGKMEWGPRALGNRSIISDPRNKDIKNIINIKIKRRENFRPFAPSILFEEANTWFKNFSDEDNYMTRVLEFKEEKKSIVPGVVHLDGTGRLQTVKQEDNPRYYKLIKQFYNITNVPMILNTSFNENEPIVCKPEEALDCFLRTKMDILVMENWIIKRNY
jgi:carbamoyltransferase